VAQAIGLISRCSIRAWDGDPKLRPAIPNLCQTIKPTRIAPFLLPHVEPEYKRAKANLQENVLWLSTSWL
jgi:hypothetical protein